MVAITDSKEYPSVQPRVCKHPLQNLPAAVAFAVAAAVVGTNQQEKTLCEVLSVPPPLFNLLTHSLSLHLNLILPFNK